jgi:hypothetical protein
MSNYQRGNMSVNQQEPDRSPNRLIAESSPYLRQHANNPVDWYTWSEEALLRAQAEDKPILLSIGYSACHWCHVMAHESFENIEIAKVMNQHFINIKVDREERPDLDEIYQKSAQLPAAAVAGRSPCSLRLIKNRSTVEPISLRCRAITCQGFQTFSLGSLMPIEITARMSGNASNG